MLPQIINQATAADPYKNSYNPYQNQSKDNVNRTLPFSKSEERSVQQHSLHKNKLQHDLSKFSNINPTHNNSQISNNSSFINAQEFRHNFKIKIQSSKAFINEEKSQIQDLMSKIERERRAREIERFKKNSRLILALGGGIGDVDNNETMQFMNLGNDQSILENSQISKNRSRVNKGSQFRDQSKELQFKANVVRGQSLDIDADNQIDKSRNGKGIVSRKEAFNRTAVYETTVNDQKSQSSPFSHQILRTIKQSLSGQGIGMLDTQKPKRRLTLAQLQNNNNSNEQQIVDDSYLIKRALQNLPENKKQELAKILSKENNQKLKKYAQNFLNNTQHAILQDHQNRTDNEHDDNMMRRDHVLENKIKYSFTIDTFEDSINFKKQLYNFKKDETKVPGATHQDFLNRNSSTESLDESHIHKSNNRYDDKKVPKINKKTQSKVQNEVTISISEEQKPGLIAQRTLKLDSMNDSKLKDTDFIEINAKQNSLNTILRINENVDQNENVQTANLEYKGSLNRSREVAPMSRQIETLRRSIIPIFSGNLASYEINAMVEKEFVKKGRKMSNLNSLNSATKNPSITELMMEFLNLRTQSVSIIQQQISINQQQESLNQYRKKFTRISIKPHQNENQNQRKASLNRPSSTSNALINVLVKQVQGQIGQKPSSRQQLGAVYTMGKYYLFGGCSQANYNDVKQLDPSKWEWTTLHPDSVSNSAPQRRFALSLNVYNGSKLIVFGGGGQYIQKIKRRETYNEVYQFDLNTLEWTNLTDKTIKDLNERVDKKLGYNRFEVSKRMAHAATIFGGALIVHGGIYGEDNCFLDDFAAFDLQSCQWLKLKQSKQSPIQSSIGPLAYHTMTAIQEPGISEENFDSRLMWVKNLQEFSGKETLTLTSNQCVFLFGGYDQSKSPSDKLYLLKPSQSDNRIFISAKTGEFKQLQRPKLYFTLQQLSPQGKGPCPRYLHSATQLKHYLAIFGGRNDQIYQHSNIALNDLHLYDLVKNTWVTIALYGGDNLPQSRWGHQIVGGLGESMMLFGGVNLKGYSQSNIYQFTIDEKQVAQFYLENENKLKQIKEESSAHQ